MRSQRKQVVAVLVLALSVGGAGAAMAEHGELPGAACQNAGPKEHNKHCDEGPSGGDPSVRSDRDRDGVDDAADNCADRWNPAQVDLDDDGVGTVCEFDDEAASTSAAVHDLAPDDRDGDKVVDPVDDEPSTPLDPSDRVDEALGGGQRAVERTAGIAVDAAGDAVATARDAVSDAADDAGL